MADNQAYYITTPIYYVNDKPHIGHAYTTIACDVIARFMRLDGRKVFFLTGTDEHGQKVEKSAQAAGRDTLEFCDAGSANFKALAGALNISNDDFIRTTEPRHIRSSQAIWKALEAAGDIYLGSYAGWYAVRDEAFYAEDELTKGADGKFIAPSGATVEWVEEPSYFFRLSAWGDRLLAFYDANPDFILPPARRNEVLSFVRGGLRDLSVSRTSFTWGVPVPDAPEHIIYVWLDALINYITAIDYPDMKSEKFRTFWPASLHMVGKDILRFHTVYWPAFLMAAGMAPPDRVFAHGWWTAEGRKMSKTDGNVIDPHDLIDTYGLDQVRYVLLREFPFGNDGDFSRKSVVSRINGELANGFGNLAQRTLSFIAKNCDGILPGAVALTEADKSLLHQAYDLLGRMRQEMASQALHQALQHWIDVVNAANRYIDAEAPWALRKTDPARMGTVLWVLAEAIRCLALMAHPFVPNAADRLLDQLAVTPDMRNFKAIGPDAALKSGITLPAPAGIFPRIQEAAGQA
jgi:methionyl-tRNA synthetase